MGWRWLWFCSLLLVTPLGATALGAGAYLHKSGPIQITVDGSNVWVVNPDHHTVVRIETALPLDDPNDPNNPNPSRVVGFALPTAGLSCRPLGLDVLADGSEVWVACHDTGKVYALDGTSGAVIKTVDLHAGSGPISVAISPDGGTALVALNLAAQVAVIDTASGNLVTTIDGMFRRPWGIAYSADGATAWVTHTISDGQRSRLSVIDTASHVVAAQLVLDPVEPTVEPVPGETPEGGTPILRGHLAAFPSLLSPEIWVPVQYQNHRNPNFTPDSTIQAALHKFSTSTLTELPAANVVLTALLAHDVDGTLLGDGWNAQTSGPVDLAFSDDGLVAWVVGAQSNDVLVVPTAIGKSRGVAPPLTEIPVGANPLGLVASPTESKLFVMNYLSREVSEIDTVTETELARYRVAPPTEPSPPSFLLGQKVFNDSADPRASANSKVACASCHMNDDTDGLSWDFSPFGSGTRKTLPLRGLGFSWEPATPPGSGQLHRTGDMDEVQDFEHAFLSPLMGGTGYTAPTGPFPPLDVNLNGGLDANLDAMEFYLIRVPAIRRSPHRAPDGTLTEEAVRGALLFRNLGPGPAPGCIGCHAQSPTSPQFYTDFSFHDVGGFAPPLELQIPGSPPNTPSLIGAWNSPPFTQVVGPVDGDSIAGVIRHAATSPVHGDTSALNLRQRRDLTSFVNSIDDNLVFEGITLLSDNAPPRVLAVLPVSLNAVDVVFSETVDPVTAGDPANYAIDIGASAPLPVATATVDTVAGDRVRLGVLLPYAGGTVTYTLVPGPIEDAASTVGGAANNALATGDPANRKAFTVDGSITVSFGDAAIHTFASVARDAGFSAAAGEGDVSHDGWRLSPNTTPATKGFVAFDFAPTLTAQCGVASSADILSASFSALPRFGHRNALELHRSLKPWGDPPQGGCTGCAGALTRTHATFPTIPWTTEGAGSYAGSGTDPLEYHPSGTADLALTADATVALNALNERLSFGGGAIADAFRFWFDNPAQNFGYAVEVVGPSSGGTAFFAAESEGGENGIVLSVTFAVAPNASCGDVSLDNALDAADVALYRAQLADPAAALSAAGEARCGVIDAALPCDLRQLVVLRREVEGSALAPGIANVCLAAGG